MRRSRLLAAVAAAAGVALSATALSATAFSAPAPSSSGAGAAAVSYHAAAWARGTAAGGFACSARAGIGAYVFRGTEHVTGSVYIAGCAGSPPVSECRAQAILYEKWPVGPERGKWLYVKEGPKKVGPCNNRTRSSVNATCAHYPDLIDYKVRAEVAARWEGRWYPDIKDSAVEAIAGVCL